MARFSLIAVGAVYLSLTAALPVSAGGIEDESGVCTTAETTWFSAKVQGEDKFVSLCGPGGATGAGRDPAWLQFRLGNDRSAALVYPLTKRRPSRAFTYRRYTRPRTSYLKVEFIIGGLEHAILEFDTPDETPSSSVEYRVRRVSDRGELLSKKLVAGQAPLTLLRLERFMPRKPFNE